MAVVICSFAGWGAFDPGRGRVLGFADGRAGLLSGAAVAFGAGRALSGVLCAVLGVVYRRMERCWFAMWGIWRVVCRV
jgi:hypothetical protein